MAVVPKPDYLSRDYAGLRQSLLTYAQQTFPDWQPSSEGDFGLVMLELWAYMGDIISYYTDRAQFENYLPTATQRDSILNLAFMLGYIPNAGTPAQGTVNLTSNKGSAEITIPEGTQIITNRVATLDGPLVFETTAEVVIPPNPEDTIDPVPVTVLEGTTVSLQYLGESNGQPSQVLTLPHPGVYRDTIQIFVEDEAGSTIFNEGSANEIRVREWIRVERLLQGDDVDKIFETRYTATTSKIYFGDDINGAIPATGLKVYATYRHGFGGSGNIGPSLVRFVNAQGLGGVKVATTEDGVFLSSEMVGGADPESDDSIRFNAPRVYRTQERAVTEQDFIEIALGTEGVSKASVVVGTFTSVTVFITAADGGPPSETLIQAVAERFEGKTLAGVTVQVGETEFVPINFGTEENPVSIEVAKGHSIKNTRAAARRAIRAMMGNLEFGDTLAVGRVYQVLGNVEGVKNVDVKVMARGDAAQTGTSRIIPKPWEVLTMGSIYLDVYRKTPGSQADLDDLEDI